MAALKCLVFNQSQPLCKGTGGRQGAPAHPASAGARGRPAPPPGRRTSAEGRNGQSSQGGTRRMDLGITGRTALITGASKGIGYAAAESLAREGCHVHLAARTEARSRRRPGPDPGPLERPGRDSSGGPLGRGRGPRPHRDLPRRRHPRQQRGRDPGWRPPGGGGGDLAGSVEPQGLRLHQHLPGRLRQHEGPRQGGHHQRRRGGRRSGRSRTTSRARPATRA